MSLVDLPFVNALAHGLRVPKPSDALAFGLVEALIDLDWHVLQELDVFLFVVGLHVLKVVEVNHHALTDLRNLQCLLAFVDGL